MMTLKHVEVHRNAARCLHCGDEIESTHRHNFKSCSCGAVCVDGGLDYVRRVWDGSKGEPEEVFVDLSETTIWDVDYDDDLKVIERRLAVTE